MKLSLKILFIVISILIFVLINVKETLAVIVPTGTEVLDKKCVQYLLTHTEPEQLCEKWCNENCLAWDGYCKFGDPTNCLAWGGTTGDTQPIEGELTAGVNIFGVYLGPTDEAIPRLIRILVLGFSALLGLFSLAYGVYGLYVRSTSADNPEKVEEGYKIFKNAVLGLIMGLGGVIFVQIAALITGLEDNIFEFNLIPKQGVMVHLTDDDVENGICLPEQFGYNPSSGITYICEEGKWIVGHP